MRKFDTGATRDGDTNKPDLEGFISPLVTREYGKYMHEHRVQSDGTLRASDNWQKGIPLDAYAKSLTRHVEDVKLLHRGYSDVCVDFDTAEPVDLKKALCAVIFNASGYLHEILSQERELAALLDEPCNCEEKSELPQPQTPKFMRVCSRGSFFYGQIGEVLAAPDAETSLYLLSLGGGTCFSAEELEPVPTQIEFPGYEHTGEYREPQEGEDFQGYDGLWSTGAPFDCPRYGRKRWILRTAD